jgi:hypothetical protein
MNKFRSVYKIWVGTPYEKRPLGVYSCTGLVKVSKVKLSPWQTVEACPQPNKLLCLSNAYEIC